MSEHEQQQREEPKPEEREETLKDLDVPEQEAEAVKGGLKMNEKV